jgi:hypothetical protein
MRSITALSKAATEWKLLIANGNWFHKRIPLTNTEASELTDAKIKLEILTERASIGQQRDNQVAASKST